MESYGGAEAQALWELVMCTWLCTNVFWLTSTWLQPSNILEPS